LRYPIKSIYFIAFWFLLNLLQASLTDLTSDEGYYWFYSRHLQWGYYDHPPFLALMVKIGYSLFRNELGVRLLNVILNSIALLIIFDLMPRALLQKTSTYILLLSLPLLNYLSFIIFPDGPLLFFSAVYLWCYKKFIEKKDFASAVIMGIAVAFMMYSKYHAVLIIGFTVLSNFKLLKSKYFYISMLLALVLFLPHMWWQYKNNFITFGYHLEKRTEGFSGRHVFEYISQQILAIGPGSIFIPFVYRTRDQFAKTLLYIILGTLLFFFITSFKGFVHFHWTSLIIFPIILLTAKYYNDIKRRKLLYWLVLPFLVIIFLFRIQLMFPLLPVNHVNVDYYNGRREWAEDISSVADGSPVLFEDQFRESSLYSFYSGQMGVALFSGENRKSQYELWNYEDSLQSKSVLYVSKNPFAASTSLKTRMGKKLYYYKFPCFLSFYKIPIKTDFHDSRNGLGDADITLIINNPRNKTLHFSCDNRGDTVALICKIKRENKIIFQQRLKTFSISDSIPVKGNLKMQAKIIPAGLTKGKYEISFGFQSFIIGDSYNSIHYFTVK
jgi:hypothetical protein